MLGKPAGEAADSHKPTPYGGCRLGGTSPAVGWTRPPPRPLVQVPSSRLLGIASRMEGPTNGRQEKHEQEHYLY